jgi:hypothetical protein
MSRPVEHLLLLGGLLFFLDLDDLASLEVAAAGADGMRHAFASAIGANDKIGSRKGVLRTTAIAASLGMFALWMWGHETFSFYTYIRRAFSPSGLVFNEAG